MLVLKSIKQTNQPSTRGCGEYVSLCENMSDFVQFKQYTFAHYFQRTDFAGILFLRQENLSISTLAYLCKYLEVSAPQFRASFTEIGAFSPAVFSPPTFIVGLLEISKLLTELFSPFPSEMDIGEKIQIIIQKVCSQLGYKLYLEQSLLQS